MHFEGSVPIKASRDKVWAFVIDPDQVGPVRPRRRVDRGHRRDPFQGGGQGRDRVHQRPFNVNMEFAEQQPPDRALIKAHGQAPGSAVDATAEMRLSDGPDGTTVMDWNADVNLSGTLASVGARLIEGTANKMIGQTFDCMREKLEA